MCSVWNWWIMKSLKCDDRTEHVSSHHFLPVYYQSNEWAGVYGTRERDHEAWSTKQHWGSRSVSSPQQTDELSAATSSSSCSRTACLPPSSGRTSSSCWTSSSSCAASWRRGLESSRHAEPPTSTASGLPRQTGSVRSDVRTAAASAVTALTAALPGEVNLLRWTRG